MAPPNGGQCADAPVFLTHHALQDNAALQLNSCVSYGADGNLFSVKLRLPAQPNGDQT